MVLGIRSQTQQDPASFWLDQVVQDLSQDQELVRIKKLLIYTCTQTWESNLDRIHTADLQNLLQMLWVIAPTLEKLQIILHSVANSLNKPAEYRLIADAILEPIKQRYPLSIPVVEIDSALTNYQTIAEKLHQDPEEFRIRKLLLFACKNVWISDRHQLAQLDLATLVEELHSLAASSASLRAILASRIQKLSKSAVYTLIVDKIIQEFQLIYPLDLPAQTDCNAELESTKLLSQLWNRSPQAIEPKPAKQVRLNSVAKSVQSQQAFTDLFDLRLEIIRYLNPFRVKILLFSLLHEPFNQTPEHHLMLKNYDLDDLLRRLLQTYRSFTELEANLFNLIDQLDEAEEYTRVVQAVLQASKSFYAQTPIVSASPAPCQRATPTVKPNHSSSELTGPESLSEPSSHNKLA